MFSVLCFFFFTYIQMTFNGREKAFCVLDYALSQSHKTVQHAFVREFSIQSPRGMQIWTWHTKIHRGRLFVLEKMIWST